MASSTRGSMLDGPGPHSRRSGGLSGAGRSFIARFSTTFARSASEESATTPKRMVKWSSAGVGPGGLDQVLERAQEPLVVAPHQLVVPLHAGRPAAAVDALDRLDHAVLAAGGGAHDAAGGGHALVVERVDARLPAGQPALDRRVRLRLHG